MMHVLILHLHTHLYAPICICLYTYMPLYAPPLAQPKTGEGTA